MGRGDAGFPLAPHSGSFTRFEHFALVSRRGGLALVAFRGYLISGRRRGSAVFVRIALIVKEQRVS
jgi:hypothetical protein